jgi:Tfp pilus assembly protein PilP
MKKACIYLVAMVMSIGLLTTGCGKNKDASMAPTDIESEMEATSPSNSENEEGMVTVTLDDDADSAPNQVASNDIKKPVAPPKPKEEMVDIKIAGSGRADPFLPFMEAVVGSGKVKTESLPYVVLPPLQESTSDTSAQKVLTTKVSGIMYDDTSPSAIINVEGMDYLVRSGDIINDYKVLSISKTTVVVQLGANVYRAGVGQALTTGEVQHNQIANLENKFGGARK